jgi:exodeoxyribonuclease VII large subunit
MPRLGEDVVIVGTLCLSPLTFELQLHGDVEGAWQPKNRMPRLTIPKRSQAPQPLAQFLEHHPVTAIGFIVTETGWSDVERSAGRYVSCCVRVTPNFGDEDELVAAIEQLGGSVGIEAIVLARGGGAMLDEVGNSDKAAVTLIGQNMPFYAALGHSNDLMLLDKYADESFGTPSDFGHSLRSALERAEEIEASRRRLIKVVDENERMGAGIAYRDNGIAEAAKHAASLQEELASAAQARLVRDRAIRWLIGSLVSVIVIMLLLLKVFTHSR